MFELTLDELGSLRYQIGTLKRGQHVKYQPFAFTEQGVAMLSSVLRSERAIYMNIAIMRAFIAVRRMANEHREILEQLAVLTERVGSHDKQLASIYEAIENLLDDKADQQTWADRERIGFRTSGKSRDKS
jgi:hypothetical protein